jgi:uncharacterized protein (TIGR02421 family)
MQYIDERAIVSDRVIMKLAAAYKPNVNPLNAKEIIKKITSSKEKEIIGFDYCAKPQYCYDGIRDAFDEIPLPSRPLKKLYKDKIKESKLKFQLLEAIGTEELGVQSRLLYGFPSKKLINKAYDLIQLPQSPPGNKIPLSSAKKILKEQLHKMNLPWKIETKKMVAGALVAPAKSTVFLSSAYKYTDMSIKRLAIHEIGTHAVRSMNARIQPLKIFRNFPNYIGTEEGLAAFNENFTGNLFNDTIRKYAGRVMAVEYAEDHDLIETYQYLKKFLKPNTSAHISLRVKRGLSNSKSLGSFSKDYVYLKGYFEIQKYVKKHPMRFLYYGKTSTDSIKLIKKIEKDLIPIQYYPPLIG